MIPFQRFLDEHRDVVWRFPVASSGARTPTTCFQETFLAAMSAYPRLRSDSNHRAWVLTIAHRKALDHFRRARRAARLPGDVPEVPSHDRRPAPTTRCGSTSAALPPSSAPPCRCATPADLDYAAIGAALGMHAPRRPAARPTKASRSFARR